MTVNDTARSILPFSYAEEQFSRCSMTASPGFLTFVKQGLGSTDTTQRICSTSIRSIFALTYDVATHLATDVPLAIVSPHTKSSHIESRSVIYV